MLSTLLQARLDEMPDEHRQRALRVAEQISEQTGASDESALARALMDLELEESGPSRFRRRGLRWDE